MKHKKLICLLLSLIFCFAMVVQYIKRLVVHRLLALLVEVYHKNAVSVIFNCQNKKWDHGVCLLLCGRGCYVCHVISAKY